MDFGDLYISAKLTIPAWELSESFVRASGPGGQNVNKVSSAVQLTWTVDASTIPLGVKNRFKAKYGARLTTDGRLILEAKEHRSQGLNRQAARERLKAMILSIAEPRKRRIRTRPTRGSVRRRLDKKTRRGKTKSLRGKIELDND